MLIIAMLASLVVAMVPGHRARQAEGIDAANGRPCCGASGLPAVLTGQSRRVSLDGNTRTIVGPSGVDGDSARCRGRCGRRETSSGRDGRRWSGSSADGASTGAILKFSWENVRCEVDVNWYNGRVAVDLP